MFHNLTNRYWGNTLLYGYDKTNNLWWWSSNWVYYISAIHGIPITVDSGANCNPSGFLYNSQPYYIVSGGVLWHDGSQWVISAALGYKTEEYSETVDSVTTWYGDAWWSRSTLAGTYTARGSGHGGATKFVEMGKVVGWKSNDKYGVYAPETDSGLTGNKYAGWLIFKDAAHATSPYKQVTTTVVTVTPATEDTEEETETTTTIENSYITEQTTAGTVVTVDGNTTTTVTTALFGGSNIVTSLEYFTETGTYNNKPLFTGTNKKLWYDGSNWIISAAAGTKAIKTGYWSGSAILGTLARQWEATAPAVTDPVTPDPLDTDKNAYNIIIHKYSETIRQTSQLIAQVAQWL